MKNNSGKRWTRILVKILIGALCLGFVLFAFRLEVAKVMMKLGVFSDSEQSTLTVNIDEDANFPEVTGEYNVGRTKLMMNDYARYNIYSPTEDEDKYVKYVVNAYYPTEDEGVPSSYVSDEYNELFKQVAANEKGESPLVYLKQNAIDDAKCAKTDGGFPVVIFAPGGSWPIELYSYLFEEMASHGYIVFAVTDPVSSPVIGLPDGSAYSPAQLGYSDTFIASMIGYKEQKEMVNYTFDNSNTFEILHMVRSLNSLNESEGIFKDRISLGDVVVSGHSIGGASAVNAALKEAQIDGVIIYDSYIFHVLAADAPELSVPSLYIEAEGIEYDEEEFKTVATQNKQVVEYIERSGKSEHMVLEGAAHASFMVDLLIGIDQEQAQEDALIKGVSKNTLIRTVVDESLMFLKERFRE